MKRQVGVHYENFDMFSSPFAVNHSCMPNIEVSFECGNHVLSIEALQDINPGEVWLHYSSDTLLMYCSCVMDGYV